ncbi:SPS-sensor component ssy1 [Candidozyma auris]
MDIGEPHDLFHVLGSDTTSVRKGSEDNEVDLSSGSWPTVELKEEILAQMSDLRHQDTAEYVPKDPQNKKFKYLDMYQNLARAGSSTDTFNLSALDDFNQYVKKAEINDTIQQQLRQNQLKRDKNMLSIVRSSDLNEKFCPFGADESTGSPSKNTFKLRYPWNHHSSYDREKQVQNPSDFSELNVAGGTSDENARGEQKGRYLERKLEVRHLQMISFGGTLGVGLFLNCGKAFTIAGGFGTVLAFLIVGAIVLATLVCFCEMVTFVSVVDGVSGLSSRFVDEAFGFATGWLYFLVLRQGKAASHE